MRPCLHLTAAVTTVGLLCALAAPAAAQEGLLDYQGVRDAIPEMQRLSEEASGAAKELHVLVDELEATRDGLKQGQIRERVRARLEGYHETKRTMLDTTRRVLGVEPTGLTDQEVVQKLAETNLLGIHWSDANFDKCVRDLSAAVAIPIRLQHRVVQKNKVTLDFASAKAETVLATLCNGFDLRYVVFDGEVVIYKKITPTEERFLEYQAKHPETKLKYWEREDASGEYKREPVEGEAPPLSGKPGERTVANMDVELLRESLLKLWIIEQGSERYNQMRIAQKAYQALTPLVLIGDREQDAENIEARRQLDKELRHYLLLELDGSIEVMDIVRRVLGRVPKPTYASEDAKLLEEILAKELPRGVAWREKDLEACLRELGAMLGTPVAFTPVPKHVELTCTFEFPAGFQLRQVLDYVNSTHPLDWRLEDGVLKFDYKGDIAPARPGMR